MRTKYLIFTLLFTLMASFTYAQEGSKQFIQSIDGNGETDTMCIVLFNNADVDNTWHTYNSPAKGRLYFCFMNGENAYLGTNVTASSGNDMDFRVRGPISGDPLTAATAPIVFGPQATPGDAFNETGEGYIANVTEATTGAQEVVGNSGYDGIHILDSTQASGIYYIEFENISTSTRTHVSYFDLSIKQANGLPASGRLFSYAWSMYNDLDNGGFDVADLDFYVYHTKDSLVTQITWDNVEPGGYSILLNESGPITLSDTDPNYDSLRFIARQSTLYTNVGKNDVEPTFPIFFTEPDTNCFPLATTQPQIIPNQITEFCPFTDSLMFSLTKEALVEVFLDFDGNDSVYTPNSADVLLLAGRFPAGTAGAPWDGKDGNGNTVPLTQNVKIILNVIAGEVHMPLGDFEENPIGFNGSVIAPSWAQSSSLTIYHDDTQFPSSSENLQPINLEGCSSNNCHIWGNGGANNSSYGNQRWINSWWPSYEAQAEFTFQQKVCSPLPITIIEFHATQVDEDVSVNWEIADAINVSHFNVQHSENGIDFRNVGTLSYNEATSYSFKHEGIAHSRNKVRHAFYRLQNTDLDGSFNYSDVKKVNFDSENVRFQLAPNPVKQGANILVKNIFVDHYQIIDVSGKVLKNVIAEQILDNTIIETNDLKTGFYILRINNEIATKIFVQ